MAVPAEKLDILLKDLLDKANESQSELNIISLDEYKKENENKIVYLKALKTFVVCFNKTDIFVSFLKVLALIEVLYFLSIYSKIKNYTGYNTTISELKEILNVICNNIYAENIVINEVRNYPNKKLKATSLKINNDVYKVFKYFKNRIEKINEEITEYNFSPPPYMENAIENIDHIINKVIEYKDKPRAILSLFNVYYSDPEDLEWTDEDREYVRKHYASKEE